MRRCVIPTAFPQSQWWFGNELPPQQQLPECEIISQFAADVSPVEQMVKKIGEWIKLSPENDGEIGVINRKLSPGSGELLKVERSRKTQ